MGDYTQPCPSVVCIPRSRARRWKSDYDARRPLAPTVFFFYMGLGRQCEHGAGPRVQTWGLADRWQPMASGKNWWIGWDGNAWFRYFQFTSVKRERIMQVTIYHQTVLSPNSLKIPSRLAILAKNQCFTLCVLLNVNGCVRANGP